MPSPTSDLAKAMIGAYNAGEMERVIALAAQAGDTAEDGITLLLGMAQQATGRYEQAAARFRELSQRRPEVSAYWNNLGVVCRQMGDTTASEQAMLTARSLAPNDAEVHYNLGLLYIQQRRWPLARQTLMEAVQLSPDFIEARLQAAHACYICGDNTGQEAMLIGAAGWPPQAAEQAMILAAMLSVQGELDVALHTLAQAQLPPEPETDIMRLRIVAQRSALHERSNQPERAREELRQLPLTTLDLLPPQAQRIRAEGWSAYAALAMRAIAVMLEDVITEASYVPMLRGAERLVGGLRAVIAETQVPWSVAHVGARAELIFAPEPPRDAAAMRRVLNPDALEACHLYLINQGVLIAPFHNMMLISPQTHDDAIDRLIQAARAFADIWLSL